MINTGDLSSFTEESRIFIHTSTLSSDLPVHIYFGLQHRSPSEKRLVWI